jgi:hypothetical protein
MLKLRVLAVLALSAVFVSGAFADDDGAKQDKKKKAAGQNRSASAQLIKQLDKAGVTLTEDQNAKVTALAATLKTDLAAAHKESGLTPEILKKRQEAGKAAREAGKKGKELQAAMDEAVTLTDEQKAALKSAASKQQQFRKEFLAVLTDAQKEQLPAQLAKQLQGRRGAADADAQPKPNKKNKPKKDAA